MSGLHIVTGQEVAIILPLLTDWSFYGVLQ